MNEDQTKPIDIDELIQELLNDDQLFPLVRQLYSDGSLHSRSVPKTGPSKEIHDAIASFPAIRPWIVKGLRTALRIEMTVIPPYLVSLWSIRVASVVRSLIADVVQEEMLHMGLVCNCLTTLGDDPPVDSRYTVPQFPAKLPVGILPTLTVGLESFSEELIRNVFVPIEAPSDSLFRYAGGKRFWTIGAFYKILELLLRNAPSEWFADRHQLADPDLKLTKITSPTAAADAMLLIREQGEGTPGPLFGSDPFADVAHYFRFWEILHHKRIKIHSDGSWSFTGNPVPHPGDKNIFHISRVADEDLEESIAFDEMYTLMLQDFQAAWKQGDQQILEQAKDHMFELPDLALAIFKVTHTPSTGECHGPRFQLR